MCRVPSLYPRPPPEFYWAAEGKNPVWSSNCQGPAAGGATLGTRSVGPGFD